jgi:Zn-dependent M16 (insulinase) family peptidase
MSEFLYWKTNSETRRILSLIKEEVQRLEMQLTEGYLLNHSNSDYLAREYARQIGTIEGLKFIERLFQHDESERESDE